ncbi:MAG: tetratricopeptide repeat protein [Chloroflexota bacterium]
MQSSSYLTHLPVSLVPLIGRRKELDHLAAYFSEDIRLITIHGVGGIGKTHLAIEVARQQVDLFVGQVYFVGFEDLNSTLFFWSTLAEAIGFRATEPNNLKQQLFEHLATSRLLLVLDGCEHIIDKISLIAELLKATSGLRILATSRERLGILGEVVFSISGVAFPDNALDKNLPEYDAVQLFVYNGKRVLPEFQPSNDDWQTIAQICQYVDGLPLAILLATSWLSTLSPQEILSEIEQDVRLLESPALTTLFQSKSLLHVFSHSWELLTPHQRNAFMQLSVFRGRFTRQAAQVAMGTSLYILNALVNKSMLQWDKKNKLYYIHSVLRQYGRAKLDAEGKQTTIYRAYFDYWHDFVHTHPAIMQSQKEKQIVKALKEKLTWKHELEDLRACLLWGIENQHIAKSLEIVLRMTYLWKLHRLDEEQLYWLSILLQQASDIDPVLHMKALNGAGELALFLADDESCRKYLKKSIEIAEQLPVSSYYHNALFRMGDIEHRAGQLDKAIIWHQKGLEVARDLDDLSKIAISLNGLGLIASDQNKLDEALPYLQEGLTYARQSESEHSVSVILANLGVIAHRSKRYDEAENYYEEAWLLAKSQMSEQLEAVLTANLGEVAYERQDYARARILSIESMRLAYQIGVLMIVAHQLEILARIEIDDGSASNAAVYYGAAEMLRDTLNFPVSDREMPAYMTGLDVIRAKLSAEELEAAWQEGQETPLDSILASFL